MDEYTLDNRGDIGAWVREAAMNGNSLSNKYNRLILNTLILCSYLRPHKALS